MLRNRYLPTLILEWTNYLLWKLLLRTMVNLDLTRKNFGFLSLAVANVAMEESTVAVAVRVTWTLARIV